MDNNYKFTFKMDTYVQGTLILLILGCGLLSLFGLFDFAILGAVFLFPLGVWQVSSGLLFSILLKDKKRFLYLCSVIGFFTSAYIPSFLNLQISGDAGIYAGLSLMGILALYYFSITMKDMVATNTDYMRSRK